MTPVVSKLAVLCLVPAGLVVAQSRSARAQYSESIEDLARVASPAVVQISVQGRAPVDEGDSRRAGYVAEQRSSGSGVIVDPAGYIVTNAHVVGDARKIDVSVVVSGPQAEPGDHRHYVGKLVGLDRETDLAVVKIEAGPLPTIAFVDSSKARQGQLVMAIGSPLGLDNSVTLGIISAPVRHLDTEKPMYYIQTDAPINPGNSGGALLDMRGGMVGINTMIMSRSGGSEGIGFAIPGNIVKHVYEQLRNDGRVRRGVIGVLPQDLSPTLCAALGLEREKGVLLADVTLHSAAEAAGLQQGDIVLSIDGKPLNQARQMAAAIFEHSYGDKVQLEIQRGKETLSKSVTIMARPRTPSDLADLASREAQLEKRLGVLALTVDDKVTPLLPDLRRLSGVVVAAIAFEYAALNPGLAAGDVIYELNGKPVASIDELRAELDSRKSGAPVALLVERSGQLIYVTFELE